MSEPISPLEYINSLEATIKAFEWAADSGAVFEHNNTLGYRLAWKGFSIWANLYSPWAPTHRKAIKAAVPYYETNVLPWIQERAKAAEAS